MSRFDLTVLGAGSAGVAATRQAVEAGARVCLVEMDAVGGHYLNRGLFPVRTLLADPEFGKARPVEWEGVRSRFHEIARNASEALRQDLEASGVTLLAGKGIYSGSGSLSVETDDGKQEVQSEQLVLAMGSAAESIVTVPFDDECVVPLDRFLDLKALPETLLILGDGVMAIETALFFNRLGVKVFLCNEHQRLIADRDPELIDAVEKSLKQAKIKTLFNKKIASILKKPEGIDITLDGGIKFAVQTILVGYRRVGHTAGSVDAGLGIEMGDRHEVWVNERMQTSLKNLYAVGSVTGHERSLERSQEEGRVAAANALGKEKALDPDTVPFRLHTQPPLAAVGCKVEDAHHKGFLRPVEGRYDGVLLNGSGPDAEAGGFCKLVADRESRKVIGAQILGQGASEMLTMVMMAIQRGMTVKTLAQLSPGFGDASQGVLEAARACLRKLTASP
ncbi:NAD(P)/FAD-dependent oxidoreductase [Nitrospina watsonii]|uniref:Pyruvate dehydrogenase, dihydrolipoyl dehydrogenase component E3 n=1 Tax=Nitrospina watsonii TaxID=1323948 RepID=A0ABM9HDW7_9BACT|nr:NAD(P)/FAD-dependent oxidoreductase [Nitrospina watsonii]CAI2718408.1 putative pyruvate dehydrogenase, dihydrolipoyl dehydrogenase component E3 [Nitrospina watsonii]